MAICIIEQPECPYQLDGGILSLDYVTEVPDIEPVPCLLHGGTIQDDVAGSFGTLQALVSTVLSGQIDIASILPEES